MLKTLVADGNFVLPDMHQRFSVAVSGTFGGGTIAVQYATDAAATTWATYASGETGSFTAAGEREFAPVGAATSVRIVLSGATSPSIIVAVRSYPW